MSDTEEEARKSAESKTALETIQQALATLTATDKTALLGILSGAKPKQNEPLPSTSTSGATSGTQSNSGATSAQGSPRNSFLDDSKLPKLQKFSGSGAKNEPSFRVWHFEITNLRKNHCDSDILRAIHRAVTGNAADIVMRLGLNATLEQVLAKFEHVFGSVSSSEKLLCDFYSAQQKSSESIAEWSCRLEDLLSHKKLQSMSQRDIMLKSKFFSGLYSTSIKNAIRHKFEAGSYDDLLVLAREAEDEFKMDKAVAKAQTVDTTNDKLEQLMREMKEIKGKLSQWEEQQKKKSETQQNRTSTSFTNTNTQNSQSHEVYCYYCKEKGHIKRNCPKLLNRKKSTAGGKQ